MSSKFVFYRFDSKSLKNINKSERTFSQKKGCLIPWKYKADKNSNSYGDYQTEFVPKASKVTGLKLNSKNINLKRRSVKEKKNYVEAYSMI
jgi:hypothetical protein